MKSLGNVLILGDSYSTFRGALQPGLRCYYGRPEVEGDVKTVEQTWWWQVIDKSNSNLVLNSSFSGSTVCTTEREDWEMKGTAFVYRLFDLAFEEFFTRNKIDTVLIFGGTNDSWINAPLGKPIYNVEDITLEDLKQVFPAFCYMINLIKRDSPSTKIYLIINCDLNTELAKGIKEIAEHFGEKAIELKEIDKLSNHPTAKGMMQIAEQLLENI